MNKIKDNELDQVSGGKAINWNPVGRILTSNHSNYSSGSAPKYRVGQYLKVIYKLGDHHHPCGCTVEGISDSASYGKWCPEFGYTIRICDAPPEVLTVERIIGRVYTDVYESCLNEK